MTKISRTLLLPPHFFILKVFCLLDIQLNLKLAFWLSGVKQYWSWTYK